MPWTTITSKQLARELGIDHAEMKQKHELIKKIIAARERLGMTQAQLARKVGVSQSRIGKIESRIGTYKVSFDVLFRLLSVLGCNYKVSVQFERLAA
jgi:transcriptional regulator with XRE-family HTH domain